MRLGGLGLGEDDEQSGQLESLVGLRLSLTYKGMTFFVSMSYCKGLMMGPFFQDSLGK